MEAFIICMKQRVEQTFPKDRKVPSPWWHTTLLNALINRACYFPCSTCYLPEPTDSVLSYIYHWMVPWKGPSSILVFWTSLFQITTGPDPDLFLSSPSGSDLPHSLQPNYITDIIHPPLNQYILRYNSAALKLEAAHPSKRLASNYRFYIVIILHRHKRLTIIYNMEHKKSYENDINFSPDAFMTELMVHLQWIYHVKMCINRRKSTH